MNINNKFKNPYFWFGVIALILSSAGIDVETLTNWPLLWDSIVAVVMNPFRIGAVIVSLAAMFNDNSTPGFDIKFKKTS